MLKLKPVYLSLLTGLLLVLSWPPLPTAFILFIALVPLLMLHQQVQEKSRPHFIFWLWTYLAFLIFNTGTTWWVWYASPTGCIMMLVLNSLVMSLPFLGYSLVNKAVPQLGWMALLCFYLAFEYWHFNWSASWPWLTLGKGFAAFPGFIQWYEYTGELGGSALILIVNMWIARILVAKKYIRLWQPVSVVVAFGIISSLLGQLAYPLLNKSSRKIDCIITQPNIDPYTEKFGHGADYMYPEIQLDYAIATAEPFINGETDLILMPETAIVGANDESGLNQSELMKPLVSLTKGNNLSILAGAETYALFKTKERPTITARYDSFSSSWYDSYNTALLIDSNGTSNIYHKSRLVPGVEKMPFEFLEQLSINLGGTSGSLGVSKEPVNFTIGGGIKVAPLICYESIFGDYTNEFVKRGANLLAVATNDGWWRETPGYEQHLLYGAIRCIETRREMVRSANTGVSAKIDRTGQITHQTKYNERIGFACTAQVFSDTTFYVKYGNYLGVASCFGSALLILLATFRRIRRK